MLDLAKKMAAKESPEDTDIDGSIVIVDDDLTMRDYGSTLFSNNMISSRGSLEKPMDISYCY